METLKHLRYELPSLTVYRTLRNDPVIHGFEMLSELLGTGAPLEQLLDTYSELCTTLYHSEFTGSLYDLSLIHI